MWSFVWVFWADDSFTCLTHLSSIGGCGLAETVGLWFCVDSDSASSVFVLDLVCVVGVLFSFSFVLGTNKQHCTWSWNDAMVSLISRWILNWWGWLVEDRWELCPWRPLWSIADISVSDGCGYGWTVYLRWAKCWRNNRLSLWGSVDLSETIICFFGNFECFRRVYTSFSGWGAWSIEVSWRIRRILWVWPWRYGEVHTGYASEYV